MFFPSGKMIYSVAEKPLLGRSLPYTAVQKVFFYTLLLLMALLALFVSH